MKNHPWKSSAICVFAPLPKEVDRFCKIIETRLAADGIDTIVLIIRYNYKFKEHPECTGDCPLSYEDVKKIVNCCKKCGIELIPDMNLLGHQTVQEYVKPDGLLRAYPEFSETPMEEKPEYSYSLCPSHPKIYEVVTSLMDEIADAFECRYFHIGMDEVFYIGMCDRCKGRDPGHILAEWVNKLADRLLAKGITPMMWGDRLLNSFECRHGPWDASKNGTWTALELIRKEIIITDWHYHNWEAFPSVEIFAKAGHKIYLCPFNSVENTKLFLDYAAKHDENHILGVMETTWFPCSFFMDIMEGVEPEDDGTWHKECSREVKEVYDMLFG